MPRGLQSLKKNAILRQKSGKMKIFKILRAPLSKLMLPIALNYYALGLYLTSLQLNAVFLSWATFCLFSSFVKSLMCFFEVWIPVWFTSFCDFSWNIAFGSMQEPFSLLFVNIVGISFNCFMLYKFIHSDTKKLSLSFF